MSDFTEEFAAYREDLAKDLPRIRGVVVDLQGEPVAGAHVAVRPGNHSSSSGVTADDGSFAFPVLEETEYLIVLGRALRSASDLPVPSVTSDLFVDPDSGEVNRCGTLSYVSVARESITDLVIRVLPELLTRPEKPVCNEGRPGWALLSGVVLDPDGEPFGNTIRVCAWRAMEDDRIGCSKNAADGPFAVSVPSGAISLRITMEVPIGEGYSTIIEWWYSEDGVTTDREERTEVVVDGMNIEGIEIRLPGPPYDLPGSG
ncbi:MAG: carboxypeptidase regulatory-like domain-containing protein [Chloroflexi bacterium]|nr:carboxypeptidase regulatory-like domain-containing protein [Chloroflexota bacterium]